MLLLLLPTFCNVINLSFHFQNVKTRTIIINSLTHITGLCGSQQKSMSLDSKINVTCFKIKVVCLGNQMSRFLKILSCFQKQFCECCITLSNEGKEIFYLPFILTIVFLPTVIIEICCGYELTSSHFYDAYPNIYVNEKRTQVKSVGFTLFHASWILVDNDPCSKNR